MTNQNTNNDILWLFEETNQNDILENIHFETQQDQVNDIFWSLYFDNHQINTTPAIPQEENQNKTDDIFDSFNFEDTSLQKNNNDILGSLDFQDTSFTDETKNQITIEKKISSWKRAIYGIIFFIKYIGTSSLIFAILIASTNYSAYIEIARSYLNPEALEQNKQAMLASVQSATIVKTPTQNEEEVDMQNINIDSDSQNTTEKIEMVKNKTYHSMDKLINSTHNNIDMNIEIVPYENRIVIPKIWKNIPLVDVQNKTVENVKALEDIFMKELVNGIVRYPGSARPWENGNSFIFWHSSNFPWLEWKYNDVFALMDNLSFGDEIIAYYGQKKYIYKVKEKKVIKPGDTSVLKRNNNISEITLMTCWPVGTTLNRMVVVWELVKE